MDFNKVIDRKGTYCTQWDYIEDRFGKGNGGLLPFTISDMDFESPIEIIEALKKRVGHGIFGYSRWNNDEYKGAISNWYLKRSNATIEKEWIVYSPSVLYSISLLLELLIEKGDSVMMHTPRYDGFTKLVEHYNLYEVEMIEVGEGSYKTNLSVIEEGFKEGVKVFVLCNPQNPTGKVWSKQELKEIIDLCKRYGVYLISDEIHMDITRKEFTSVLNLDRSISMVVSSPSKTFNTPALGGSYVIIPQEKIKERFLKHTRNIDGVSTAAIFGVISTITAYNHCEYWVDELNKYISANLELVKRELDDYKGLKVFIPEATYLMWIDFKETGLEPNEFQRLLMEEGKVAIMSGELYGDRYKIRLNVGSSILKVREGIKGIKRALDAKK